MTLQQVYINAPLTRDLFAAKIKQAEKWSAELNTGEVFISVREVGRENGGGWRVAMGGGAGSKRGRKCGPNGARNWSRN